ncbi:MAG: class I SAM-dependent methyltransferase [Thermoleophilia bacterium]|nr:class I SAM-dependent methyltransferase [Thermoleophilia bacterium]
MLAEMARSPITVETAAANRQHYEVPAAFFACMLGPHLKYSSCLWPDGTTTLEDAERAMLDLTTERADLHDGQRVLELGCGWGSLTLWMAERFPGSEITAVSNSGSQRAWIMARAAERDLGNVRVITADIGAFETGDRFDRIVSVEMMEHTRNWHALLDRVSGWLRAEGRMFVHVFCHRTSPYMFRDSGPASWMARNFFTGGMMPSFDLIERVDAPLVVEDRWRVGGEHYAATARAWLENLDHRHDLAIAALAPHAGRDARRAVRRWRQFLMACEELFAADGGREWHVGHYRLKHRA